jgi:hypothetical protein
LLRRLPALSICGIEKFHFNWRSMDMSTLPDHSTIRNQVEKAELEAQLAEARARLVEANVRSLKAQLEAMRARAALDEARAAARRPAVVTSMAS